jgi:DNA-binding FrmR family transcriptional regulator
MSEDKIINRLKRLEGQIRGLEKLVVNEFDCEKVIIQFKAAKSALEGAFAEFLNMNLEGCLRSRDEKKMKKLVEILTKK